MFRINDSVEFQGKEYVISKFLGQGGMGHVFSIEEKHGDSKFALKSLQYFLPDDNGSLLLWSVEQYDPQDSLVKGTQFWEVYDQNRIMQRKSFLDVQFYLHQQEEFIELVQTQGFNIVSLYGDYSYAEFQRETSPFMIWVLSKS